MGALDSLTINLKTCGSQHLNESLFDKDLLVNFYQINRDNLKVNQLITLFNSMAYTKDQNFEIQEEILENILSKIGYITLDKYTQFLTSLFSQLFFLSQKEENQNQFQRVFNFLSVLDSKATPQIFYYQISQIKDYVDGLMVY